MKSILVTGGAGFIGSNFLLHFHKTYPEYKLINLDLLTYAANPAYIKSLENQDTYHFVKGDICNRELVQYLFDTFDIRGVVHFAAESHVDNSISGPEAFIRTNITGTFVLLDVARKSWMNAPFTFKEGYEDVKFLHVSTDEVYGSLGAEGYFTETTPYAPNSPYSSSKASADLLVRSYFHTFGMPVLTTNCSNNYGPRQHSEKLIPTIIRNAISGKPIPIYGDGQNVRDWLFVHDHCTAIDAVFHKGRFGETYNIGSRNEQNNLVMAQTICSILDDVRPLGDRSYSQQITFVKDRPGHDRRYAIDSTKIETELAWKAESSFREALKTTIMWYLDLFEPKSATSVGNLESTTVQPPKEEAKQENPVGTATPPPPIQKPLESQPPLSENPISQSHSSDNKVNVETKKTEESSQIIYTTEDTSEELQKAIEGMSELKVLIQRHINDRDTALRNVKEAEEKATMLIRRAQDGHIEWSEANRLAALLLEEQQKSKQYADRKEKEIFDLQIQLDKVQKQVDFIRHNVRRIRTKTPDSSETFSMLERMKDKVSKQEILGDLYGTMRKDASDPELEKNVDKALGIDPAREALEKLKSQLGIQPKKTD